MCIAMKEVYGEQARSTTFHWHQQFTQGHASASPKPKSGRPGGLYWDNSEYDRTMLTDDDSLSQQQIAFAYIPQTIVRKIILSFLSCNLRWGVRLRFYTKRSYGRSICVIGLIFSQVM